ncbi:hypothetical protein [Candidatus Brocadia sapporoensis]|uniref:hypothetical protein n=1 Tax=Candidatus Brocadia sapporoensis TaxID=392547 RepID=UPI001E549FC4|nr:hypothetical protein [Candidatus Brocadia sapporoensis]
MVFPGQRHVEPLVQLEFLVQLGLLVLQVPLVPLALLELLVLPVLPVMPVPLLLQVLLGPLVLLELQVLPVLPVPLLLQAPLGPPALLVPLVQPVLPVTPVPLALQEFQILVEPRTLQPVSQELQVLPASLTLLAWTSE